MKRSKKEFRLCGCPLQGAAGPFINSRNPHGRIGGKNLKRRIYPILCSMLSAAMCASCAGTGNSRIVRENPGPGADSYREASDQSGGITGSPDGDGKITGSPDGDGEAPGSAHGSGSRANGSPLTERLQIPEVYERSIQSEDGTFELTCNAEIEVPQVSRIPVYKVKRKQVDQAWFDRVTEVFFGGHPIYDGNSYIPDPRIYGNDVENPMEKKEVHPQVNPENPSEPTGSPGYFYGIVEMPDGLFSCKMDPSYGNGLNIQILRKKQEALNEVLYWDSGYYASEETTTYPRPSKEEAERTAGITPEQAQETAKKYLKGLGMDDFMPRYTCLGVCCYFPDGDYSMNNAKYIDTGYLVSCTREVAGIPITEEAKGGDWFETGLDDLPRWSYEKVKFFVNQEGLQEAWISNLYSIGEQQAADVELLGFPEIAEIFEQAIQMNYENTDALHMDIRIDRVQLGYMRVYNPAVDNAGGILIPVWDFFGSAEGFGSKTQEEQKDGVIKRAEPNVSLLTINASDGSVIDRQLGY